MTNDGQEGVKKIHDKKTFAETLGSQSSESLENAVNETFKDDTKEKKEK